MRSQHADGFAGLDEQRFVFFQLAQRFHDAVERLPIARGFADAAINDQILRTFGDFRIEIVHQHAQGRFRSPCLAAFLRSARGADDARVGEIVHVSLPCLSERPAK